MPLSELNTKLLKAFLDEAGPSTGKNVRTAMSALGFDDVHVRIILSSVAEDKSAHVRWEKNADGLYVDVN